MRRLQCRPDCSPHLMLFARVRRIGNFIARKVIHRELRDLISSRAIFLITKARMIRIELNYVVAAANCLIQIAGDGTSVDVIRENCLPGCRFCFCSHSRGSRQKLNRPPILHSEGPMAGFKNLFASLSRSSRDSSSPDRPSQRRADSNTGNSDSCCGDSSFRSHRLRSRPRRVKQWFETSSWLWFDQSRCRY